MGYFITMLTAPEIETCQLRSTGDLARRFGLFLFRTYDYVLWPTTLNRREGAGKCHQHMRKPSGRLKKEQQVQVRTCRQT